HGGGQVDKAVAGTRTLRARDDLDAAASDLVCFRAEVPRRLHRNLEHPPDVLAVVAVVEGVPVAGAQAWEGRDGGQCPGAYPGVRRQRAEAGAEIVAQPVAVQLVPEVAVLAAPEVEILVVPPQVFAERVQVIAVAAPSH